MTLVIELPPIADTLSAESRQHLIDQVNAFAVATLRELDREPEEEAVVAIHAALAENPEDEMSLEVFMQYHSSPACNACH